VSNREKKKMVGESEAEWAGVLHEDVLSSLEDVGDVVAVCRCEPS
jgi:hypothetical protein